MFVLMKLYVCNRKETHRVFHTDTNRNFNELESELTPWSRVLPEKLTRSQVLKILPAFYGIRRFSTAFTRARHLSLS